jgi:hypothetical protein
MSTETAALEGGDATAATETETPFVDKGGPLSLSEAVELRRQRNNPAPVEKAADAAPVEPQELPDEGNADPETDPGETQEAEVAQEPPIERPKSWSKDEDAEWQSLPRAMQHKIVARESERDKGFLRSQQEAADERKAAKAERETAEKARQQYEAQLPQLMQTLSDAQQSAFADIRTVDDVTKLANEDPFRYLQWQAHQTKLQAVNAELERAKGQQTAKQQTEWAEHVQKENQLAADLIPELADKDKGPALVKRAAERLSELGFKPDELSDYANGKQKLSIYDHRFQQLIADSLKLADIQGAAKPTAAAKPVPPIQRPGTARPATASAASQIQALQKQLTNASGDRAIKISAQILGLRRGAVRSKG